MAKTAAKTSTPKKSAPAKSKVSGAERMVKVSEDVIEKLKALNIEEPLQRDLEWCLGSYRADNNPIGLYEMLEKAEKVFQAEKEKKTKGVTAKFIEEINKVLNDR